jgi:hypothetical protein
VLIKFFRNGKGAGAGPVGYLVAERVLAYDGNRDLIRDADGQPLMVTRDPLPEVLRGDPSRTEALIDASRHQWTYRAGVISFAVEDAPSEAQQAEVMDAFEELAFAGLDGEQYDMLWVRHSHEDRIELHFCTPRLELTTWRSLNIAPPGYQDAFDSLRDLMNQRHGWADPMELERAQEVRDTIEAPTRAHGRDELHAWILDQVSVGLITDRASMVDALADAGFDLPRVGKAYLTAQDPETGERWRLKGEIFHEDWQADPAEREIERGARHDPPGLRRLNGIPPGELQDRFDGHCERRAAYHRERYAPLPEREQELVRDADRADQALADDFALGDLGDGRDGDRLDDGRELVLDVHADTFGADGTGPDADRPGGADLADAGPRQDRAENLHTGRDAGDLHQDRGEMNDDAPDSLGTRLDRLRRAVGDGLRNLSRGIERVRGTLDEEAASPVGWYRGLRDVAHTLADRVNAGVAWLAERRGHLQRAGREVERELELSEGRRRVAETELEAQERDMDRGLTH